LTLAKQMNVQVGHRLAGVRTVIHHEPEAVRELELSRDIAGDEQEMAEHDLILGGGFRDARNYFFRDDQQVNGCLRLDIMQHEALLVLVFDSRGNFAVDNFLKESFHGAKDSAVSTRKK
jgi:hypothetical protein